MEMYRALVEDKHLPHLPPALLEDLAGRGEAAQDFIAGWRYYAENLDSLRKDYGLQLVAIHIDQVVAYAPTSVELYRKIGSRYDTSRLFIGHTKASSGGGRGAGRRVTLRGA